MGGLSQIQKVFVYDRLQHLFESNYLAPVHQSVYPIFHLPPSILHHTSSCISFSEIFSAKIKKLASKKKRLTAFRHCLPPDFPTAAFASRLSTLFPALTCNFFPQHRQWHVSQSTYLLNWHKSILSRSSRCQ